MDFINKIKIKNVLYRNQVYCIIIRKIIIYEVFSIFNNNSSI